MINITFFSFFLLAVFIVLPFVIAYFVGINKLLKPLKAISLHVISLCVLGIIAHFVTSYNNLFINMSLVLVMSVLVSYITAFRIRVPRHRYTIPLLISIVTTTVLLVLCSVIALADLSTLNNGLLAFSLLTIVCSSIFMIVPKGMKTFHNGLSNDAQLYHFLLANGAKHGQAIGYLMRRSVEKTWIYALKHVAVVFVAVCPWVFVGQLLVGTSVLNAVFAQLLLASLAIVAPVVALFFALLLARKYALDAYNQLIK